MIEVGGLFPRRKGATKNTARSPERLKEGRNVRCLIGNLKKGKEEKSVKSTLEKHYNLLEEIVIELETLIEEIQEKIDAINEKADARESGELTEKEQEKLDYLETVLQNLETARDEADNAKYAINEAQESSVY